jgi:hypothetical protein
MRTLQVTHKSSELALWLASKEGTESVNAQKIVGNPKGGPVSNNFVTKKFREE